MKSETLIIDIVHKKMEDPNLARAIVNCAQKLNNNFYPSWYKTIIFQDLEKKKATVYDAYAFLCVHSLIGLGKIIYKKIYLGEKPPPDNEKVEMNKSLGKLSKPYRGNFTGGSQGNDGEILVDEPVLLSVVDINYSPIQKQVSGSFPLEVGSITSDKTLSYFSNIDSRLARWPYYSEYIYLLQRIG